MELATILNRTLWILPDISRKKHSQGSHTPTSLASTSKVIHWTCSQLRFVLLSVFCRTRQHVKKQCVRRTYLAYAGSPVLIRCGGMLSPPALSLYVGISPANIVSPVLRMRVLMQDISRCLQRSDSTPLEHMGRYMQRCDLGPKPHEAIFKAQISWLRALRCLIAIRLRVTCAMVQWRVS